MITTSHRFLQAGFSALLLMLVTIFGSCAAQNYNFDGIAAISGSPRVDRLVHDLGHQQGEKHPQDLFDLSMIPLAHTHLQVFSESSDEGISGSFVEANVDAYLPLFGVIQAKVTRYDSFRNLSEHHEYNSYLWGLFQSHREKVDTRLGMRESKERRFLWFFGWRSTPKYTESGIDLASF